MESFENADFMELDGGEGSAPAIPAGQAAEVHAVLTLALGEEGLELRTEFPKAQLFLLIGEDQAHALASWHRFSEIPEIATICVAARAQTAGASGKFNVLTSGIPGLRPLEMPLMEVSATDIRLRLAHGQDTVPLVFDPVARYIAQHHLYRTA